MKGIFLFCLLYKSDGLFLCWYICHYSICTLVALVMFSKLSDQKRDLLLLEAIDQTICFGSR